MSTPKDSLNNTTHIAIVGGGISGLSAAWYLQQAQHDGHPLSYTVFEAGDRWGGKVMTDHVDSETPEPFIVEAGPDSFLAAQKPWAVQLARELGLEDEFLSTNDHNRTIYILNRGKLTPMPDGIYLIAPTRVWPFVKTSLFSPWAKLRMGMDWFIPARQDNGDESLADFIGRRMGQEAVDKLAEPLMAGIYNAAAENLSVMATFPRFRAMEVKYGSLIRGMLAGSKAMKAAAAKNPNGKQRKLGAFVTFNQGTDVIIKALAEQLTGDMPLNCGVDRIETHEDDTYRLHLSDGSILNAGQVILAVPAYNAAQLIRPLSSQAAESLETIRYVSTGTVSLAYRTADMDRSLNGHGVVIPRSEGRRINAITWTSTKFDHRAPEGYCLVRAFIGGSRTPEMLDKTDDEIVHIVRDEFRDIMGLTAEPLFHRIYRWPRSTPQYDVGHLERVAAVERHLPPGVHITGSPYRGIGMPDCVRQGKETAEQIVALMREEAPTL